MTFSFASKRTSLAPFAADLKAATDAYAACRTDADLAASALRAARLTKSPDRAELADISDQAIEALSAAQERVATLMADIKKQGVLDDFYAFVAAQKRTAT